MFGGQLKTIIGEVMDYKMTTEDGTALDAAFAFRGIMARIVYSAVIMGTTATLLKTISKKAVEIYKS